MKHHLTGEENAIVAIAPTSSFAKRSRTSFISSFSREMRHRSLTKPTSPHLGQRNKSISEIEGILGK